MTVKKGNNVGQTTNGFREFAGAVLASVLASDMKSTKKACPI